MAEHCSSVSMQLTYAYLCLLVLGPWRSSVSRWLSSKPAWRPARNPRRRPGAWGEQGGLVLLVSSRGRAGSISYYSIYRGHTKARGSWPWGTGNWNTGRCRIFARPRADIPRIASPGDMNARALASVPRKKPLSLEPWPANPSEFEFEVPRGRRGRHRGSGGRGGTPAPAVRAREARTDSKHAEDLACVRP